MKERGGLGFGSREAQVDDLAPLVDGPAQPAQQGCGPALRTGAKHAHAPEVALRRERPHDPGARGPVTSDVTGAIFVDHPLALRRLLNRHGTLHFADELVGSLDATVDDRHAHTGSVRSRPGPFTVDLMRP